MISNLKIGTKFSLALFFIFMGGMLISGFILNRTLEQRAEDEVATRGVLMLDAMTSVRSYTSQHINPLVRDELATEEQFISESVPAFSAREVFENFRGNEDYENFFYKEASLNPTNLRDDADGFETEIIEQFMADNGLTEQSGFRTRNGERVFYIARPLRVGAESCLECHSDPALAPQSMINSYGDQHGFGFALNDIIAAQIMYVPAQEVFDNARQSFLLVLGIFAIIFSIAIFALNIAVRPTVVRPLGKLAGLANKVAEDEILDEDLNSLEMSRVVTRGDELGQLARTFQKMARQVKRREQALKMQVQELRVEIDNSRKTQTVSEITESEYFQNLKKRATDLRKRSGQDEDET